MLKTKITHGKQFEDELNELISEVHSIVINDNFLVKSAENSAFFTENVFRALAFYKTETGVKNTFRDILGHACRLSREHDGDERLTADYTLSLLKVLLKMRHLGIEYSDISMQAAEFKKTVGEYRKLLSPQEAEDFLHTFVKNSTVSSIVIEAYKMAGLTGKIFLERKNQPELVLEFAPGSNFLINTPRHFLGQNNKWSERRVKCILIDGIIESVGEIHNILESASKTKEPVAVFCLGYADEVLSTIYTNLVRETINVIPVKIPTGIEGVNMLNDIAAVCECDVVSSLKGELISTIKFDQLAKVSSLIVTPNRVTINNPSSLGSVNVHVGNLIEKRDAQHIDDVSDILSDRIKALVSNSAVIGIPQTSAYDSGKLEEQIDYAIVYYKRLISRGIISLDDVIANEKSLKGYILKDVITGLKEKTPTTTALLAALEFGTSAALMLYSSYAAITADIKD